VRADPPKLARFSPPLLAKLVGSVRGNLDLLHLVGVEDFPEPVPSGAPEELFDRLACCADRLQKRFNPFGVCLSHRSERIDRQQKLVGLFLGDVQH
jgi:hypothetical protein